MDTIIKFDPALPCATTDGEILCNKPATVAIVYPAAGGWMIMPICEDCTIATAKVYGVAWVADELKPDSKESTNGQ